MTSLDRRAFLGKAAGGVAGVGLAAACGGEAVDGAGGVEAAEAAAVQGPGVRWRLTTSFPRTLDILHGTAERLAERTRALTGGRFDIRVYPAGELVPGLQVMDAVQQGTVQAGFSTAYYYIGKNPALSFDAAVPFGLNARQQMAWLYHGGGLDLLRPIYARFGIIQFPMANTGTQMGGWFRRPVDSLADLRGFRMRIPGLGGEIMTRLGVTVQVLAGGDIYPALERGAIDATEWVGPYDDEKLGLHEIAPYYYYPGWWEPGVNASLMVSLEAWEALPPSYQAVIEAVSREVNMDMLARYDAANPAALARLVDDHGVQLRPFSDDILEAARRESASYLEEQAAAHEDFRRVYDQWSAYRREAFGYFAGNELSYASFAFQRG